MSALLEAPFQLNYKAFGARAVLIEWPAVIDERVLADRINFEMALRDSISEVGDNLIIDIISAYHSLTLIYQNPVTDFQAATAQLEKLYSSLEAQPSYQAKLFHIPVCYAPDFALDMNDFVKKKNLSSEEVISLHTQALYTVYFMGFLPGFLYLGGLDKQLHCPRKFVPGLSVPKGSVAIGGEQTGVYPQPSPGGWHVIGNTPLDFFNANHEPLCFAQAGDRIKFHSISESEYQLISAAMEQDEYSIESEDWHA